MRAERESPRRPQASFQPAKFLELGAYVLAHWNVDTVFSREEDPLGPDRQLQAHLEVGQHVAHHVRRKLVAKGVEIAPGRCIGKLPGEQEFQQLGVRVESHAQPAACRTLTPREDDERHQWEGGEEQ